MTEHRLRIGFIPLADAAALIVAADKGFAAERGLTIDLVREISWSNVRDKLNIGLFDAAHLLAPVAVASSLGIGHVKVPLVAPFMLRPRTAMPLPYPPGAAWHTDFSRGAAATLSAIRKSRPRLWRASSPSSASAAPIPSPSE